MPLTQSSRSAELDALAKDTARNAWPAFQTAGWTYHDSSEVPTVERLEGTVRRLLAAAEAHAAENPLWEGSVGSGRFQAHREIDGADVVWGVTLDFGTVWEDATPEMIESKYARRESVQA